MTTNATEPRSSRNYSRVNKAPTAEKIEIAKETNNYVEQFFLANFNNVYVREALATNPHIHEKPLMILLRDKEIRVLENLSKRTDLKDKTRVKLSRQIDKVLIHKIRKTAQSRDIHTTMKILRVLEKRNSNIDEVIEEV